MAKFFWPLGSGRVLTSPFGQRAGGFHAGADFGREGGSAGMRVYAVQSGTVKYCGAAQGYGGPDPAGWIVVDSDDSEGGGCWEYGHIVRLDFIKPGVKVVAGQQIGFVNPDRNTNGGTAPHLHVSFMPRGYNPAEKISPMSRLYGAIEPESSPVAKEFEVKPERPDFNEYPIWSGNYQNRRGTKIDLFLLHTQEGSGNADGLARWLGNRANGVSYHYTVSQDLNDNGVTVVDVVDTDYASWSCLSANNRSINLCFAGSTVKWSREHWLRNSKAIDAAAWLAVQDCKKYKIPFTVISPPYTAGRAGISDHNYVTKILRDGTHTDVGPNFPWDYFAKKVAEFSGQKPPQKSLPKDLSDRELLEEIWVQLRGLAGKGWPQLGGLTPVDAIAKLMKLSDL